MSDEKTPIFEVCDVYKYIIRVSDEHFGFDKKVDITNLNDIKKVMKVVDEIIAHDEIANSDDVETIIYYLYTVGLKYLIKGAYLRINGMFAGKPLMITHVNRHGCLIPFSNENIDLICAHGKRFWVNKPVDVDNVVKFYNIYIKIRELSCEQLKQLTDDKYEKLAVSN